MPPPLPDRHIAKTPTLLACPGSVAMPSLRADRRIADTPQSDRGRSASVFFAFDAFSHNINRLLLAAPFFFIYIIEKLVN
jgi:hypothetical protein